MKNYLKTLINPSIGIITLTYILFLAIWIITYFSYLTPVRVSGTLPLLYERILLGNQFVFSIINLGVVFFTSILLTQMINKYAFIRTRSFLPTFIYLGLTLAWIPTHTDISAFVAALLILMATHIALGLYKIKNGVEPAFLLSFLLAIATILIVEYALLIIFFWIGFFFLKCFSGRMIVATLLGFITPFILLGSTLYLFFHNSILDILNLFLINHIHFFEYSSLYQLVYPGVLGVILLISLFQMLAYSKKENIQTRNELNFLKTIGFGVLLLLVFVNDNISFFPLTAGFYSILISYSFTFNPNKFNNILFSFFLIANIIILTYFILL